MKSFNEIIQDEILIDKDWNCFHFKNEELNKLFKDTFLFLGNKGFIQCYNMKPELMKAMYYLAGSGKANILYLTNSLYFNRALMVKHLAYRNLGKDKIDEFILNPEDDLKNIDLFVDLMLNNYFIEDAVLNNCFEDLEKYIIEFLKKNNNHIKTNIIVIFDFFVNEIFEDQINYLVNKYNIFIITIETEKYLDINNLSRKYDMFESKQITFDEFMNEFKSFDQPLLGNINLVCSREIDSNGEIVSLYTTINLLHPHVECYKMKEELSDKDSYWMLKNTPHLSE